MSLKKIIPPEFLEPNWRLWSFVLLIALGILALFAFPMKGYDGYIDPFYSPTVVILPLIGLFRLTCYAFRKYYHRHLFGHPPGCSVSERLNEAKRAYSGETGFFRVENLHRYFMYFSAAILPFFFYDFYLSLFWQHSLALRFGSLFMLADTLAVTIWVFSCHSVRHIIGGRLDCFSCTFASRLGGSVFKFQSRLNARHEALAWASLALIIAADLYIRALAAGLPLDFTILVL